MGLWDLLKGNKGLPPQDLAKRMGMETAELEAVPREYHEFHLPKRNGGTRRIAAPNAGLKRLQRRLLRRIFAKLNVHPAVTGFQPGHSIVSHAGFHVARPVLLTMDLNNFFNATSAERVHDYFRQVGWNRHAAKLLVELVCHQGGLPQGAPTSPRLSNLVNYIFDARLAGVAQANGARYSRYADDLAFSFDRDDRKDIVAVIHGAKAVAAEYGYTLYQDRKLKIRRPHQRQTVTGLVVNARPGLPRSTRRWLRAVEHRTAYGGSPTLSPDQLAGWRALQTMIEQQREVLD